MKKTFKKQMAVVFGAIAMIGYLSVRFSRHRNKVHPR